MYDERPMWEQNKNDDKKTNEDPKRQQSTYRKEGYPTAPSPSPILAWWEREDPKRRRGELNEIDINESKAAANARKVERIVFKT